MGKAKSQHITFLKEQKGKEDAAQCLKAILWEIELEVERETEDYTTKKHCNVDPFWKR